VAHLAMSAGGCFVHWGPFVGGDEPAHPHLFPYLAE